jgi:hypothetical protein
MRGGLIPIVFSIVVLVATIAWLWFLFKVAEILLGH